MIQSSETIWHKITSNTHGIVLLMHARNTYSFPVMWLGSRQTNLFGVAKANWYQIVGTYSYHHMLYCSSCEINLSKATSSLGTDLEALSKFSENTCNF